MRRRLLFPALACLPLTGLLAQDEDTRPRHKIAAAELHEALSRRFPLRLGLGGLLELRVSAPRLLLLPARNQLGATLLAQPGGPGWPGVPAGEVDLLFSLRYEGSDQSLRAYRPEVRELRLPGVPPEGVQALQRLLPALAREAVGEVVLHRFSARELALPDTMGFEPEKVTVLDDGLLVVFTPKRR
jgi:hypothetical protein